MTKYAKDLVDKMPLMPPMDLWKIIEAAQEQLKAFHEMEEEEMAPELQKELFRRINSHEEGGVEGRPWRESIEFIKKRLANK